MLARGRAPLLERVAAEAVPVPLDEREDPREPRRRRRARPGVDGGMTSLAKLGFDRVGIDDAWQACHAGYVGSFPDADGTPLVNRTKFPSLKNLVAYGKSKGLKMGFC